MNDFVEKTLPEDEYADYWVYCANKGCEGHAGGPYGQEGGPDWLRCMEAEEKEEGK